ncbi:MAG: ferritin-like domain-containing protein [Mycobacteriales bacterium]
MSLPLLTTLLEAEHATVYGYGLLGARLDEQPRRLALLAYDSHRARRDQLAARLREHGGDPEPPPPAYDVAVGSAAEALALATRLEEGMAVRWRDLVAGTDDRQLRTLAVTGLQECAVRAAQWRQQAGIAPPTVAWPGAG